jgi:uncharacterized protein
MTRRFQRAWRRSGEVVAGRSTIVLVVATLVTLVFGVGLTRLEFATGDDSYINEGSQVALDNEAYQERFGGETMIVLFTAEDGHTVADLFTEPNLSALGEVESAIRADDRMFAVVSPITALEFTENLVTSGVATDVLIDAVERDPDPDGVAARQASLGVTAARLAAAGEQSFENPAWIEFLLFENTGFTVAEDGSVVAPPDDELVIRRSLEGFIPDTRHALLAGVIEGNADLDALADADAVVEDAVAGSAIEGFDEVVTGTPTYLTDINDYLQGGMLSLGALALATMAVILVLAFRVRWRLVPLLVVVVGVVWAFGLAGFIGLDLSLVVISGLPILIGIGIDFAIQTHNRVEEEVVLDGDESPFAETASRLGPWLVIATVAAAVSFLAMQISRVPMVRDFGVLLAIGIVCLLIAGLVLPLAILGARERRSPTREARESPRIEATVAWFGSAPRWVVGPFLVLAIGAPALGLALEGEVQIESDPINWANPDTDTIRNARTLEEETGFATTLGIYLQADPDGSIFTDEVAQFTHDFTLGELADRDELVAASSLTTTLSYLLAVPDATSLSPTGAQVEAAYEVAPPDIQRLLVTDDGTAAQISLRVGPSSLEERATLIDQLEADIADPPEGRAPLPDDVTATPAGLAVVGVGLLENLTANRAALTVVALAAVALWLVVRLWSVARALLAMVPVLIAVGISATAVALLGITISPMTTVSGPLVAATAGEFTVLILGRYLEERERGRPPDEATHVAARRTGRAFFVSALTTAAGFAVLILSALPLLSDFGMIVALNVSIALLSALVVLPPLLVWTDRRGWMGTPHATAST